MMDINNTEGDLIYGIHRQILFENQQNILDIFISINYYGQK